MTSTLPEQQGYWHKDVNVGIIDLVGRGKKIALLALVVFTIWALLIPLASAISAPGKLSASGQNFILQHPIGGLIREINVKEGTYVKKGQLLFVLDPKGDQAELTRLTTRRQELLANRARLEKQKSIHTASHDDKLSRFSLRGSFKDTAVSSSNLLLVEQLIEFQSGRDALVSELDALKFRKASLEKRLAGQLDQIALITEQLAIQQGQINSIKPLIANGYLPKQQLWDIELEYLRVKGELATVVSASEETKDGILEVEAQISNVASKYLEKTAAEMTDVVSELAQISDELEKLRSDLSATEIVAPGDGILIRPIVTNIGTVVAPGDIIAEIVPQSNQLELRAQVLPIDVGSIQVGQKAEIQINGINKRKFKEVNGTVTYVSADSRENQDKTERFFDVVVRIDEMLRDENGAALLSVGMTGTAFLKGQDRTFATYIVQPIVDSLNGAFSEK